MSERLAVSESVKQCLGPYLPPSTDAFSSEEKPGDEIANPGLVAQRKIFPKPFVTLTFATSLDAAISLRPGVQTHLSGAESKAMTHFLRSRHDAILIGVGTAEADDPGLNCRLWEDNANIAGKRHPRAIILDPQARWDVTSESKVLRLAREGAGLAPFVLTALHDPPSDKREVLERYGGKYVIIRPADSFGSGMVRFDWQMILNVLAQENLGSVMVEGGATVINSLLETTSQRWIDAIIVTIAPLWLGQGGVIVSPSRHGDGSAEDHAAVLLDDVCWHPLGRDVVMAARISAKHPQ
jgi:2,5-diamino-6-(ribosylamino)-4(3H)-pyrimidinone 5'-phosphate reductase